jgi:hypothetical protein
LLSALVGIVILMTAVLAVLVISSRSLEPEPPTVTREVTRQVAAVTVLPGDTAEPLPTLTPLPTFTPYPTPTDLPTATPAPTPTPVPLPEWRGLGDLSSVEYTASTVVQRERPRPPIGNLLLGRDRIVLMAVGKVRLGVDLTRIRPSDIVRNGNTITVRLPRAEVLSVELLPEQSRVFDSQNTWLFSQYQGLELEALDSAKRLLFYDAQNNREMLDIAETLARMRLRDLLLKAGFQDVHVEFVDR